MKKNENVINFYNQNKEKSYSSIKKKVLKYKKDIFFLKKKKFSSELIYQYLISMNEDIKNANKTTIFTYISKIYSSKNKIKTTTEKVVVEEDKKTTSQPRKTLFARSDVKLYTGLDGKPL